VLECSQLALERDVTLLERLLLRVTLLGELQRELMKASAELRYAGSRLLVLVVELGEQLVVMLDLCLELFEPSVQLATAEPRPAP
jgi:hypothetical protein